MVNNMEKFVIIEKFKQIMALNGMNEFASDELGEKFFLLSERMLEVNSYMNLTAITDVDEIILKHYADSLTAARYIPSGARVIDVGCGGGFPSLPLAIARPDVSLVSIDSTAKKIDYIADTAKLLRISNICPITCRAEDLASDEKYREKFDVAVGRAVARLNVLSELCIPFVRVGGTFLAMKASKAPEELDEAKAGLEKLGCAPAAMHRIELYSPDVDSTENGERYLIISEKIGKTPKNYPRNYSQIKKKPL